jgi:tetratricopeptide (TPR) repeat protein
MMEDLLAGLVPGLPEDLRSAILQRAEGVPLYAVETVRMLIDRGLLVADGAVYRPAGEIEELDVPETLQALIAARLDGLQPEERRLLQDGAVLGKTFTSRALSAVSGIAEAELEPILASLVRKEVLSLQADPRSPEQGQYGFLQDLVRHVAYETLSRRERRARHLAAAAHLEQAFAEDELAEVLAAHYVAANAAVPDADDAADVRRRARETLVGAGERADALGAPREAHRYLAQAAELADEPLMRADLLDRAGWHAVSDGDFPAAERGLTDALAIYEQAGEVRRAALVSGRLAQLEWDQGRHEQGLERAERALDAVSSDEPDEVTADIAARLGTAYAFAGNQERAIELLAQAIDIAEALALPETLARAFSARGMIANARGHQEEALAYLGHGLTVAREHELWDRANNLLFNLSDLSLQRDRYADALAYLDETLELARRRGSRPAEWSVLAEHTYPLAMLGRWDDAVTLAAEIPEDRFSHATTLSLLDSVLVIRLQRGDVAEARRLLSLFAYLEESSVEQQDRAASLAAQAVMHRAEGRLAEAVEAGVEAAEISRASFGAGSQTVKQGLVQALEAAFALGERERVAELLSTVDAIAPGVRPPYLEAQAQRFRARLAGADESAEACFAAAARGFRELGIVFWLAVALLEHGEWLLGAGRAGEAEPLLAEAGEIFERLEARPWLERLGAARVEPQRVSA